MIAADDIVFNDDDGTAWVVVDAQNLDVEWDAARFRQLDRPCDICGGAGWVEDPSGRHAGRWPCLECSNSGRHTFRISVACDDPHCTTACPWKKRLRVSVVPGMVLPVVDWFKVDFGLDHPVPCAASVAAFHERRFGAVASCTSSRNDHGNWLHITRRVPDGFHGIDITPPENTKPGDWLVKLTQENP